MTAIVLHLTAAEPLILTDGPASGMSHASLDYIPGSMILGAVAGLWLRANPGLVPDDTPEFRSLFLDGSVCYLNCYPEHDGRRFLPAPRCLKQIKRRGGIPGIDEAAEPYISNSLAFAGADGPGAESEAARQAVRADDTPRLKKCKPAFLDPQTLRRSPVRRQWQMHVAMDEGRRRARDSALFGYESLAAGQRFQGAILCADPQLAAKVAGLLAGADLCVGHSRSAGYGRCLATCRTVADWRETVPGRGEERRLTLQLVSDFLPSFSWQHPLDSLVAEVADRLGCQPVLRHRFVDYRQVDGFNGCWRLPRPAVTGMAMGSVLVFDLPAAAPAAALQQLAAEGIGGRRQEGFGRVWIEPAMLQGRSLRFGKASVAPEKAAPAPPADPLPLHPLRRRGLLRREQEGVRYVLDHIHTRAFLDDLAREKQPSSSQLGRMRQMAASPRQQWKGKFEHLLATTARSRWTRARVVQFLAEPGREPEKAFCHEAMLSFLDPAAFDAWLQRECPRLFAPLPGGGLEDAERDGLLAGVHALVLAALMEQAVVLRRLRETNREVGS